MARKEETIGERAIAINRSLWRSSNAIRKHLESLSSLEKFLPKDENVIALFRVNIKTIENELNNIHSGEDPAE